ncbi:mitochondrial enolase superfamily member 1 [Cariama cristata]
MLKQGYRAYTRSCAWLGYPGQQLKQHATAADLLWVLQYSAELSWAAVCHEMPNQNSMLDAKQQREIKEAIQWVTKPAEFKPSWIKEPTFPDENLHVQIGCATLSKALALLGIGGAAREHCHNRVLFKQLLQAKALSYLQIDSCRLGSVKENLSVLLIAKKFQRLHQRALDVVVWALSFSSMDLGVSELVQRLIIFDYIPVAESLQADVATWWSPHAFVLLPYKPTYQWATKGSQKCGFFKQVKVNSLWF